MKSIVIGYDGSETARDAIHHHVRAGMDATGTAVVVAAVESSAIPVAAYSPAAASVGDFSWGTPASWRQIIDEVTHRGEQTAAEGAEIVRAALPKWDVTSACVQDSPYWALISEAEKRGAEMIVVGSHGHSALGRAVLGSTSQFVLNHAKHSVRIGRRSSTQSGSPLRIVVAVDGSEYALGAVREVARRRWPKGTAVRVVAAMDLRFSVMAGMAPAAWAELALLDHDDATAAPRRAVKAACELFEGSGLTVTPVVQDGDPKRVIVHEAEQWGADAIFLGAKGHSRIERFLLGSVSAAVAARAHCTVEVIRATDSSPDAREGKP
jgi:nucleotide-binding universal stress UspA family protein